MAEKVLKHFLVLSKSWINGAIAEAGSIVPIHVDPDTLQPSPHLKEVEGHEPKHTEAQQKAADAQAALHEESVAKQAEREAAEAKPTDEPEFAMPPPQNPAPAEVPKDNT